jgi:hypothetical protein
MALLSDGSIVVAAAAPNDPKLFRLTPSGAFAPGWGDAAGIDPAVGHGDLDPAVAVTNDRTLVAGRRMATGGGVAVKKYLPDGGPDRSFGMGGTGEATFGVGMGPNPELDRAFALTVDPTNGDVWVGGSYWPGSQPNRSWVRRLDANGVLQPGGVSDTANGAASALIMQDLKVVVAGYDYGTQEDGLTLFRVTGSGQDFNFGTTAGETRLSSVRGAAAAQLAVDADRRIYAVNSSVHVQTTFDVYRTTPTGTVDATFATGGKFSIEGRAYGLALTTTGRQLLVVGVDDGIDQRRARIARLWL